jgi:hypothetical protein
VGDRSRADLRRLRQSAQRALPRPIRSFGFRHVGEQIDEIDGLELVFERRLPLAP